MFKTCVTVCFYDEKTIIYGNFDKEINQNYDSSLCFESNFYKMTNK